MLGSGNHSRAYLHRTAVRRVGREDEFEINHAAYRLRQSACFRQSGSTTCTT